ncbi:UDP-3-O-(3-hydroxymyristoyl)glucosamine N-acyltransferase [Leptolyngbya sp. 'hensonii']|uniref:UDP-3-O-(3-hydroxymyristoyl)glucosamine N-acyltransferase n=1 Tax=Leptolyngbya sp. 'hensonii' TaxID=1922337 RepID=UPI00094F680F|nr:UDP-3-O-(3-hydroxymyristoyl)glucosamine N-acyltransferase [Leptolyngbya sp. 'hensonii']OLP19589.1 UDP-3-O-(3-hydroxymyristoyl)glucosamine N-acyltransferase [Leptolyngbya sp. 'hensonii']
MKFSELVQTLSLTEAPGSLKLTPDNDPEITGLAAVDEAQPQHLSYIEGAKFAAFIEKTKASALIVPMQEALQAKVTARGLAWVAVPDPRLTFAQVIKLFYKPFQPAPEIHPTAIIDPSAQIGPEVYIGPYVTIHAGVKIGAGACLFPNVVIYPGVQIGDRTVLHANCTIHERTQIGADCVIHSGVVIGAEGFGFAPTREGWFKIEQSGSVILEDRVEIGCNSTVDRPSTGTTLIGQDTKVDNLVQIAHGCRIGRGCAIAGQAGLAGAAKIGNRVILAGQVGVNNQVTVGDGAIASAKAGIVGDVAPGEVVSGFPAMPHKVFLKASVLYGRLPELYQLVRRLRQQFPEQE